MNIEGRIIGNRYEIIEKVGSGGMATVYKARDTILNRFVAVKVLRDEFTTDEEFIKRFNTEAQSAARLTHPNIVSVFDVGQEYNIYYIVMELIQGKTLKQIISEEGALPWKWTVNIAIQICSALEMAHKNGIVHRDIKPHNIIITEDGIAKVTDFGIAKAVSNSTITAFGTTIGSVHYFSPEHARGGYTDAKSDLYSLGVVMYEMITGKVPFDADTPVSVALKHMQEEPVEPIQLNSRVPAAVNEIILKAMKKDTSERYSSATNMMKDLSLALKNPSGNFVHQGTTGQFTKVIPTISENIVSENRYKSGDKENEVEQEEKKQNFISRYLEENPEKKPIVYIGIGIITIVLLSLILWGSIKIGQNWGDSGKNVQQEVVALQDFTSKDKEEAVKQIKELGYQCEVEEVYSDEVEEGKVISQIPVPGSEYNPKVNRPIKLTVSKGAKMVKMPKVKGLQIDEAIEELKKYELEVKEEREESNTVEEGVVIRQEIEENTEINAGTTVTLYVSKGPKKVSVASVVDRDIEEAKKILTESSLEVNVIYSEDTTKSNGVVLKQSLDVGSVVEEGTAITLTVNKIQELKEGTININVKSITGYKEPTTASTTDSKENTDGSDKDKDKEKETKTETKKPQNVKVMVKVDEETVYKQDVLENTENLNVTIKAKGVVQIKVYVNDVRYANEQMDMNSDNRVLNVKGQY